MKVSMEYYDLLKFNVLRVAIKMYNRDVNIPVSPMYMKVEMCDEFLRIALIKIYLGYKKH